MIWIPIALAIVAMFVMSRYPLTDKRVAEINIELEQDRKTKATQD